MWKAMIVVAVCLLTSPTARAEYFSNMRGGKGVEAQQASSKAFAGLAQTMTGLATLEAANGADVGFGLVSFAMKGTLASPVRTIRRGILIIDTFTPFETVLGILAPIEFRTAYNGTRSYRFTMPTK